MGYLSVIFLSWTESNGSCVAKEIKGKEKQWNNFVLSNYKRGYNQVF